MKQDNVKIHSKKRVYDGFFKIDKYQLQFRRYDGTWSQVLEREIFERGSGASILLYDPEFDKVVLVEQFRPGAIQNIQNTSPWLIEVAAGIIESGMTPQETAIKEAKEETGLKVQECIKIAEFYTSPGGTSEKIHLFCGKVSSMNAGGFFGLVDEHEDIHAIVMDTDLAFSSVKSGKINNAITLIALQWLEINQKNLKAKWGK